MSKKYKKITLPDGRKAWEHRVIAERLLGRELSPNEIVHHIDGDKSNNSPDNLKVVTRQEHARLHRDIIDRSKAVAQYDLDGVLVKIWSSALEACKSIGGIQPQNISKCCKGYRKTTGGYVWRYANEVCNR